MAKIISLRKMPRNRHESSLEKMAELLQPDLSSHSTFVCPTEIVAFSNKAKEFRDVNCEVVAVSVDSHFTHLAWINTPRRVGIGAFSFGLVSFHKSSREEELNK